MHELFFVFIAGIFRIELPSLIEVLGKKEDRKDFSTMDRRVRSREFCQPKKSVKAQFQAHFKACF
jgi:hypothetical protein